MSQPPTTPPPGGVTADQSMEDILASIRRILNEDEAAPGAAAAQPAAPSAPAAPAPQAEAAPLILTEEMMVSPPVPAPEAPAPMPALLEPEPPAPPAPSADALLAPAVAAAAAASVGRLLQAVSADRTATVTRGGPSIEDVVREELRPLLKDWLDQHLPGMVERLVRAEIERVVGRALS